MKVKYVRVSTLEQNTSRQEKNESEFDKVYVDKISGAISFFERPQGKKLAEAIDDGKITEVHVMSIDRIGRNILDILTVCEFLNQKQVNLFVENIGMYSLIKGKENRIFKMIVSVLGNVSEMERNNMLERQRQGIEIAKAKGVYKGRLYGSRMTTEEFLAKYKKVANELESGESLRRAAALGGVSLGVAQRVKKSNTRTNYIIMATQGERQDFKWRPNDNSSTTLARYDQEAEHWHRAFKNAEAKNRPTDYRGTLKTIGLLISLLVSLITLVILSMIQLVKWLRS